MLEKSSRRLALHQAKKQARDHLSHHVDVFEIAYPALGHCLMLEIWFLKMHVKLTHVFPGLFISDIPFI